MQTGTCGSKTSSVTSRLQHTLSPNLWRAPPGPMLIQLIRLPKVRPSSASSNSIISQRPLPHSIRHMETTGIFSGSVIVGCISHSQTTEIYPRAELFGQTKPYHRSSISGILTSLRILKNNIQTTLVSSIMPRKRCAALGMPLPKKQPARFFSKSALRIWTPRTISIYEDSVKVWRGVVTTGA